MARKDELLALAKRKGFNTYQEYRNYLAQLQGYKNYSEQRKARKTGQGLKGTDVPKYSVSRPTGSPGSWTTVTPLSPEITASSFGSRPQLEALGHRPVSRYEGRALQVRESWAKDYKYTGREPGLARAFDKAAAHADVKRSFGPGENNVLMKMWNEGQLTASGVGGRASMTAEERKWIISKSAETGVRLDKAIEQFNRNARDWDSRAKRAGDQKAADRYAKEKIWAYESQSGKSRYGLESYERMLLDRVAHEVWSTSQFSAFRAAGVEYVTVMDGPDCGWTSHDDPDLANGKVVPIEEAMRYPQAHAFCVRQFFPVSDSGKGKDEYERQKKISEGRVKLKESAVKAAKVTATAAAILGVATTEVNTAAFSGTLGNLALNGMGVAARRGIALLIRTQERTLVTLNRILAAKGFEERLTQAARQLIAESPNVTSIEQAKSFLTDQIDQQLEEFDQAASAGANVVNLMSRRVLGVDEVAPLKVVGDEMNDWAKYRRWQAQASIAEEGATKMAELFGTQSELGQIFLQSVNNSVRGKGKYARFSLPKINTIDGNTGKRVTNRYARLALAPNRLMHAHITALPRLDGTIRFVENIKLNPNGLARLGFVRGENGLITPNLSLVPPGPIRIYSRVNRAPIMRTVRRRVEQTEVLPPGAQFIDPPERQTGTAAQRALDAVESAERTPEGYVPNTQDVINAVRTRANPTDFAGEAATVNTVRWIKYEEPNPFAKRINSVTTEVRLITKWVPFNDSSWFKFRLNLKNLEIYKPSDILKIDQYRWRRWAFMRDAEGKETELFKFLSVGTNLRLKGFGLFDVSKTIRMDANALARMHHGLTNVDNNLRELMDFYKQNVGSAEPGWEKFSASFDLYAKTLYLMLDADPSEAAMQTAKLMSIMDDLKAAQTERSAAKLTEISEGLFKRSTIYERAGKPLIDVFSGEYGEQFHELLDGRLSDWQGVQWYWHMVQQNVRDRTEYLTDYLIQFRRSGLRVDEGVFPRTVSVPKMAQNGYREWVDVVIENKQDEIDFLLYKKPNLILALIEADPAKLAGDLKVKVQDVEAVKDALKVRITDLYNRHMNVLPEAWRAPIEARLAQGRTFDEVAPEEFATGDLSGAASGPPLVLDNVAGRLRWYDTADSLFDPEAAQRTEATITARARPGRRFSARESADEIRLFDNMQEGIARLADETEIVEYSVEGASTQKFVGGQPFLSGQYEVIGYRRLLRGDPDFPNELPENVQLVHRVGVRQTRSVRGAVERPSFEDLNAATVDAPQLSEADHIARRSDYLRSHPEAVAAVERFDSDPAGVRAAYTASEPTSELAGRASADRAAGEILAEMIDDSRPVPNNLYRVLDVDSMEQARIAANISKSDKVQETLGLWDAVIDKTPPEKGRRIILVLRGARGVNISPMLRGGAASTKFVTSGKYEVVQELDEIMEDGSGNIWIYMDYVRGPIKPRR